MTQSALSLVPVTVGVLTVLFVSLWLSLFWVGTLDTPDEERFRLRRMETQLLQVQATLRDHVTRASRCP